MTTTIVIDGATHEFTDQKWQQLLTGELDAPHNVMRYVIRKHMDMNQQMHDEWDHLVTLYSIQSERNEALEAEVAELKKQVLSGEIKPARTKREKEEAA